MLGLNLGRTGRALTLLQHPSTTPPLYATVLWLDLACQWLILSLYSFPRPCSPYRVSIDAPTFQHTRASAGAHTHIRTCVLSTRIRAFLGISLPSFDSGNTCPFSFTQTPLCHYLNLTPKHRVPAITNVSRDGGIKQIPEGYQQLEQLHTGGPKGDPPSSLYLGET